jgi:phosphatidylserine decarboxylase
MKIRREVLPFLGISLIAGCIVGLLVSDPRPACIMTVIVSSFVIYFFRDPERCPPLDESAIVSGADGRVMSVSFHTENEHLNTRSVKISVFLSLFDVHVNRAPLLGQAEFRGYFPGKKMFAFLDKSSEVNQHNKILIVGTRTRCLVVQLVGPFARRVVYWLDHEHAQAVRAGDRIGMMKFGSRLDVYFPATDIDVLVKRGDRVRAGETVIAKVRSTKKVGGIN